MKTKNDTLPGKQWIPSNSDVGYSFLEDNCAKCARDKPMSEGIDFNDCGDDETCDIIVRSFVGAAVEWRKMPGGEVKCLEFIPAGDPLSASRCKHTNDMSGADNQNHIPDASKMIWQPIETAPINTHILVTGGTIETELGSENNYSIALVIRETWAPNTFYCLYTCHYFVEVKNPTHWMPLPKAPEQKT